MSQAGTCDPKDMLLSARGVFKTFGLNAVLKGTNFLEGATMKERNNQVGGHRA